MVPTCGLTPEERHRQNLMAMYPTAFELFYAVIEGDANDVRTRLSLGDDPNVISPSGATPLSLSVRWTDAYAKSAALIEAGARTDIWEDCGMHLIHWASSPDCLLLLLDHVDVNTAVKPAKGTVQFHPVGWTRMHIAAFNGVTEGIEMLTRYGGDINRTAADGSTPLHVAAGRRRIYHKQMRTILDLGADPNLADEQGRTALHILARGSSRYRKQAIHLLCSRGARVDLMDAEGRRPIDVILAGSPATETIRGILSTAASRG